MATDGPVSDGAAALHAGDWERARTAFAAALDIDETPEALDGMGRAHWWLADVGAAATYRARAFKGFRDRGDGATAARIAFWLAREYATVLGKPAAANGWFNRGLHLVDELPAGVARGWLDLARVERTHEPVGQGAVRRVRLLARPRVRRARLGDLRPCRPRIRPNHER